MKGLLRGLPDASTRFAASLVGVVHLTLKNDGKKAERKAYSLAVDNEVAKFILKENLKEISDRVTVDNLKNL